MFFVLLFQTVSYTMIIIDVLFVCLFVHVPLLFWSTIATYELSLSSLITYVIWSRQLYIHISILRNLNTQSVIYNIIPNSRVISRGH